ncbi:2'-5' RNA ligase family protein [Deinococcus koreensis]|nr:2'-5' RNA ligase family protein [Deinococcus koreensis]
MTSRVTAFRRAHGLQDAAAVSHVTVKARSGLDADLAWAGAARRVVAAFPPVALGIGGPRLFRNGTALYLQVASPDAVRLHLALLEALQPAQRFGYEGPQMTPHLSVALARRGLDLGALLLEARAAFGDLEQQPLTFTAHEVALMRKPGPGGVYQPVETWPLGKGDS